MAEEFDFVIAGGGTAAGILAYRLAESGNTVCVLEAGPADNGLYMKIPAGFVKTLHDPKATWRLTSAANPNTCNREMPYIQGKTLGGSSTINGMIYARGQAADYDGWAQFGNRGWGYADILPYFQRSEHWTGADEAAGRGHEGRLKVSVPAWKNKLTEAFIAAACELGHPKNPDYNGVSQEGVGYYQNTIWRGRRNSTATAFLHPARRRHGVDVRTEALVTGIVLKDGAAVGVNYLRVGRTETAMARREVIVAAGALNSPKLLQLSGIGPAALLRQHGVAVHHDLPGIGENFCDHYMSSVVVRAKRGVDTVNAHAAGVPLLFEIAKWLLGQPSVLSLSASLAYVFGKSSPDLAWPDYQMFFGPASYRPGFVGTLDIVPGMTCGGYQMRPESSGYIRIRSANPQDTPILDANYLATETDRRVAIGTMKAIRAILSAPPLIPFVETETYPGDAVQTDDEWLALIRQNGHTAYHLNGTCKMGPANDTLAVVDDQLRVYGISRLRVADASIIPRIPSGNTCAAVMMIAEKASDMILGKE